MMFSWCMWQFKLRGVRAIAHVIKQIPIVEALKSLAKTRAAAIRKHKRHPSQQIAAAMASLFFVGYVFAYA